MINFRSAIWLWERRKVLQIVSELSLFINSLFWLLGNSTENMMDELKSWESIARVVNVIILEPIWWNLIYVFFRFLTKKQKLKWLWINCLWWSTSVYRIIIKTFGFILMSKRDFCWVYTKVACNLYAYCKSNPIFFALCFCSICEFSSLPQTN